MNPSWSFEELCKTETELRKVKVPVDRWQIGGVPITEVTICELTAQQVQDAVNASKDYTEEQSIQKAAILLARTLESPDGKRPTIDWLLRQPAAIILKLSAKANELNGLSQPAQEELEKNSETPGGGSSSTSPTAAATSTPI